MYKDLSPDAFRNLIDLTNLSTQNKIKIGGCSNIATQIEDNIKNVIFEHTYLNEKLVKSSLKTKNILYPAL